MLIIDFSLIIILNIVKLNNKVIQEGGFSGTHITAKIPLIVRNPPITEIGKTKKGYCSTLLNKIIKSKPHNIRDAPQIKLMYITALKSMDAKHDKPPCIIGVKVAILWITPKIKIAIAIALPKDISFVVFITNISLKVF